LEQFALIASHPPDQCPTANETIRKLVLNRAPEISKLSERLGVEYLAGPIVTTEHKSYAIVKAKNVESVRNFLIESGMIQWNTVDVIHGVSMDQALQEIDKLKPIY
jgi:hypothetical protein